jgi:hypothetical protein
MILAGRLLQTKAIVVGDLSSVVGAREIAEQVNRIRLFRRRDP